MRYMLVALGLAIGVACLAIFHRTYRRAPAPGVDGMAHLWELLFADQSLAEFLSDRSAGDWPELRRALAASEQGRNREAVSVLKEVLARPDIETRTALVIWGALREFGESPPSAEADVVRGVVYEVPLERDAVVLAVYGDGRARLFSRKGKAVVWEATGHVEIASLLERVLVDGQVLIAMAAPGRKRRPIARGVHRVTLLTFGGNRTFDARLSDPLPIHASTAELIRFPTSKVEGSGQEG